MAASRPARVEAARKLGGACGGGTQRLRSFAVVALALALACIAREWQLQ